jgi:hypothetical protein
MSENTVSVQADVYCLNTLSEDSFIMINTTLLKYLKGNYDATVLLHFLISTYKYFKKADKLQQDGSFFVEGKYITEKLFLSKYKQAKAVETLENAMLLKTEFRGLPRRKYYLLQFNNISSILISENLKESIEKKKKLEDDKGASKKEKQKEFYDNLNNAIEHNLLYTLKEGDNINPQLLVLLYFYKQQIGLTTGVNFKWNPADYSKMKLWYTRYCEGGVLQLSLLKNYITSCTQNRIIPTTEYLLGWTKKNYNNEGLKNSLDIDGKPVETLLDIIKYFDIHKITSPLQDTYPVDWKNMDWKSFQQKNQRK